MVSPLRAARPTNHRLPAVDNRTRLHLPLQCLLPSLILRQVQWRATGRMVDAATSIFGMRQPWELGEGEGSLKGRRWPT